MLSGREVTRKAVSATLAPLSTASLPISSLQAGPASAVESHTAASPTQEEHPENDGPLKVDTSDSKLSRAGLTMGDVLSARVPRRQDTIAFRAIKGLEIAPEPVTLLATGEFNRIRNELKARVDRIAQDCRKCNKRFRDESWDIDANKELCLQGLLTPYKEEYTPRAAARVTEIFTSPQLFVGGVSADDIRQGAIGDCWFVAALSVVSNMPHLLERLCVAYDEKVGIYGFMFFRDGKWVTTIIDDQLFVANRQYDELKEAEKTQWHKSRKLYEETNLRGSRALYFSSSSDVNETWVPLYEKAYAKAHGDYESICGGYTGEAIEDLTGGVSVLFKVKDILDEDIFWNEELLHVNKDRVFACYIFLDYPGDLTGLVASHAYSILAAKEVEGKRFLVIRNPWGEEGEWKGAWSDGSSEWTPKWMQALGHKFGNDGRFIMEYSDFLKVWQTVDRCLLFNETWSISSAHIEANVRPWPAAPSFGDVCFIVNIVKSSTAIFVLSRHDTRYWRGLQGYLDWSLEFRVFKAGQKEYIARSEKGFYGKRSVNVEFKNLESGEYIVHVRLDRIAVRDKDYLVDQDPDVAKLNRVHAKLMESRSLAPNFDRNKAQAQYLSPPSDVYDGRPLSKIPKVDMSGKATADLEKHSDPRVDPKSSDELVASPTLEALQLDQAAEMVSLVTSPTPVTVNGDHSLTPREQVMDSPLAGGLADSTFAIDTEAQMPSEAAKADAAESKAVVEKTIDNIALEENTMTNMDNAAQEKANEEKKVAEEKKAADEKAADEKKVAAEKEAADKAAADKAEAETKAAEEKAAKEEERKNADSVFLLLRVYSKDPDSTIVAETRL